MHMFSNRILSIYFEQAFYLKCIYCIIALILTIPIVDIFANTEFELKSHLLYYISLFLTTILIFSSKKTISLEYFHYTFFFVIAAIWSIQYGLYQIVPLKYISLGLLLFSLSQFEINIKAICFAIEVVCVFEISLSFLQLFRVISSTSGMITGSFTNPTGLSSLLSYCLIFLLWRYGPKGKSYHLITLFLTIIVIVVTKCRFALVAISIVLLYTRNIRTPKKCILILLCLLCLSMYFWLKQDSTIGRLFIVYGTIKLSLSHIFWGNGIFAFSKEYMNYQANFFRSNSSEKLAFLADNISHPLNEYLLLFETFGIFGLCILSSVIYQIWKNRYQENSIWVTLLLLIAIMAVFSYCLHYPIIQLLCIISLSQLRTKDSISVKFCRNIKLLLFLFTLGVGILMAKSTYFEYKWKSAINMYSNNTNKSDTMEQ